MFLDSDNLPDMDWTPDATGDGMRIRLQRYGSGYFCVQGKGLQGFWGYLGTDPVTWAERSQKDTRDVLVFLSGDRRTIFCSGLCGSLSCMLDSYRPEYACPLPYRCIYLLPHLPRLQFRVCRVSDGV